LLTLGICATTSIRPYLIDAPLIVFSRADFTGLTMVPLVMFVVATQSDQDVEVQLPSARRLMTLLVLMRDSSWSVGLM